MRCQHLVSYQSKTFTFRAVSGHLMGATLSLGEVDTHVEKIDEVGELVKSLDAFQFYLCNAIYNLEKRRRQKYLEVQIGFLGVIGNLHGSLLAFKADPNNQGARLDNAVKIMQDLMSDVANRCVELLRPRKRTVKQVAEGRRSSPASQQPIFDLHSSYRRNWESVGDIDASAKPVKGAPAQRRATIAAIMRNRTMTNALEFAGLKKSEVRALAKEFAT